MKLCLIVCELRALLGRNPNPRAGGRRRERDRLGFEAVVETKKRGENWSSMGRGRLPDSTPFGQRSIPSMFANSSLTAGRGGSPLPLMEFLTRKLERRSTQHKTGQSDTSLHPDRNKTGDEWRRRQTDIPLEDNTCSHHNHGSQAPIKDSSWLLSRTTTLESAEDLQFRDPAVPCSEREHSREVNQAYVVEHPKLIESRKLGTLTGPPPDQRLGRKRQFADSGDTEVVSSPLEFLDRQQCVKRRIYSKLDVFKAHPESGNPATSVSVPARIAQGGHAGRDIGCGSGNFIDLTEDEDTVSEQETACLWDGTSKAPCAGKSLEKCPICTELIPNHMLQEHVESELNDLESLDGNGGDEALVSSTEASLGRNSGEEPNGRAWQHQIHTEHDRPSGALVHFENPFMISKPHRLLVLGDDPKLRGRVTKFPSRKEQPNVVFNHYADGAGWWDEGSVGVDSEAVGSCSIWEGLGSISFGSAL